jgi:DNA-binding transcriptional MerR regulator
MSAAASNAPEPERLYRIGDVSRLTDTKPFVLRFWETEFPMLQPVKAPKGHRLYRQQDIDLIRAIKRLLYEEGFTIAGARRHLAEALAGGQEISSASWTPGTPLPLSAQPDPREEGRGVPQPRDPAATPLPPLGTAAPAEANRGVMSDNARSTLLAVRQELRAILTLLAQR